MTDYSTNPFGASIDTSEITDGSITNAKLQAGTQGNIKYAGAAGVWANLAPGTLNYVLTAQGTGANPVWAPQQLYIKDLFLDTQQYSITGTSNFSTIITKSISDLLVGAVGCSIRQDTTTQTGTVRVTYTYTDTTTADVDATQAGISASATFFPKTLINPNPTKTVSQIEIKIKTSSAGSGTTYSRDSIIIAT